MAQERLQKILSNAGVASRRKSEEWITQGRVTVNGETVTELGAKADPEQDAIKVDGKLLRGVERHITFMLNKPKGYVTTTDDPEGRPTVMDIVKSKTRLFPVGRLDYASEGLLLLTNDGELAQQLTRAASHVPKTYLVKVAGQPAPEALDRLREGVKLAPRPIYDPAGKPIHGKMEKAVTTSPARIELFKDAENPWYEVTLIEGRNRQIRRMFEEVGHHVEKIKRVKYGPLELNVHPGEFRELTDEEVQQLKRESASPKPIAPSRPKPPAGAKKNFGARDLRPKRKFEKNERGERPARRFEPQSHEDRPKRTFAAPGTEERPKRRFEPQFGGERPQRSFGKAEETDRPKWRFQPQSTDDPPKRNFAGREGEDRPRRDFRAPRDDDRASGFGRGRADERPQRAFGSKPGREERGPRGGFRDERPRPSFRRESGEERPQRRFPSGERPMRNLGSPENRPAKRPAVEGDERPRKSFGSQDDRPRKSFGPPGDERPRKSFGKNFGSGGDERPRKSFGKSFGPGGDRPQRKFSPRDDRPKRDFAAGDDRPARKFTPRGDGPKRSFGGAERADRPPRDFTKRDDLPKRSFAKRDDSGPRKFDRGEDRRPRNFGPSRSSDRPPRDTAPTRQQEQSEAGKPLSRRRSGPRNPGPRE